MTRTDYQMVSQMGVRALLRRNGSRAATAAVGHEQASRLPRQQGVSNPITGQNHCIAVNGRSVPITGVSMCSMVGFGDTPTRPPPRSGQAIAPAHSGDRHPHRSLQSNYPRHRHHCLPRERRHAREAAPDGRARLQPHQLYDRREDRVTLGEVVKINIQP